MKIVISICCLLLVLASCTQKNKPTEESLDIIPMPASVQRGNDHLHVEGNVEIVASTDDGKNVASFLQEFFQMKGISASVVAESGEDDRIVLAIEGGSTPESESYALTVNEQGVKISAPSGAGLFYGAQTLIQLFPTNQDAEKAFPFVEIKDSPRFAYRGLHLDVGRHMFPVEFIKKYIDLMARHKFNRFHWHLTEDQGWRIEIKKYPKLQELGAYRKETVIGHAGTADRNDPKNFDGQRYGGFYTQDEVKDVVAFAAQRYITIVPEIEMPGHSLGALTAYPNLGCTGGPYEVGTTWGVFDDVYCAGKEETFEFLEDVIDEVVELFPGKYIHVGGDECPKTRWEKCANCQKRMKTGKLKDEHELQSYFIQRMEKYINSKGRQIIGWDEILEGGLAPNASVMSWRGEEGGIAAAEQGHDVVMTPGNWCYLDHYQDTTKTEPLAIGGFTPVSEVYSYEPIPPQLDAEKAKHILGAQCNVWTEYMNTTDYVEYMVYPRACAMAEVVWSPKEARNYDDFLKRLTVHTKRLDDSKVNYAKHAFKSN